MRFPLLELRKQINDELGPILKGLELRPIITKTDYGHRIEFRTADDSFSPIALQMLHGAIDANGALVWNEGVIDMGQHEKRNIGHNGWIYHIYASGSNAYPLGDNPKKALKRIKEAIAEAEVVQVGDANPKYSMDENFAEVCMELEEELHDHNLKITCERDNGVESVNFPDALDRQWRIAFEKTKAQVYIDGVAEKRFAARSFEAIARYVDQEVNRALGALSAARKP